MSAHLPLSTEALAYHERQLYDRTWSTRFERRMESGWTTFCALVLALAFLSARVAGLAP